MDARLYEELWRMEDRHWWFRGRRAIVHSLVDRFAPARTDPRLRICELGCGCGGNLASWSGCHDVVGIDPSEHALWFARRRPGVRAVYGRLPDAVPFGPASFDVVLMADVLEHIEDDGQAARVALSLVRRGGILVVTVPAYQWLFAPRDRHHHHFRRYDKERLRGLFDVPGVSVELLSFCNTFLFAPAAASRLASKWFFPHRRPGDLEPPPRPLNDLLEAVFGFEARLLERMTLPFGLSLVAVARKSEAIGGRAAA